MGQNSRRRRRFIRNTSPVNDANFMSGSSPAKGERQKEGNSTESLQQGKRKGGPGARWRLCRDRRGRAASVAVPSASASASASQAYGSPVVGHVYLDDSTAGANTIAGFDRHADGTLTGIPGSPFTAGVPGPARAWPREGPSSSRTGAGSCSPPTAAATRSRCSWSSLAAHWPASTWSPPAASSR